MSDVQGRYPDWEGGPLLVGPFSVSFDPGSSGLELRPMPCTESNHLCVTTVDCYICATCTSGCVLRAPNTAHHGGSPQTLNWALIPRECAPALRRSTLYPQSHIHIYTDTGIHCAEQAIAQLPRSCPSQPSGKSRPGNWVGTDVPT